MPSFTSLLKRKAAEVVKPASQPIIVEEVKDGATVTATPFDYFSRAASINSRQGFQRKPYRSARLVGRYEKPWLEKSQNVNRWRELTDYIMYYSSIVIGLAIGGFLCYRAYASVPRHDYCLVMDDNFATLSSDNWTPLVQMDGFGTGSFDWTTDDPKNAYTDKDGLHIVPTLTSDTTDLTLDQIWNGTTVNITETGCTAISQHISNWKTINGTCTATSNSTLGTIINPVRSARLVTRGKKSIKYGRVEVVAKLAKGDWLWSAIWMMPENNTYGQWPASGEIDLAETRGNSKTYPNRGIDHTGSALHWGTTSNDDKWALTQGDGMLKRGDYSNGFHLFGLEWSEDYMFTWVDNRNNKLLDVKFNKQQGTMWERGDFANTGYLFNGIPPVDPWSQTGRYNTPFDQSYYLILNLAVGSTNGYFRDGFGGKPWVDGVATSARDFWNGRESWLPTWGADGLVVKSVKMWQQGKCGSF